MGGSHDTEVSSIQRGNLGRGQALGDGDDGRVHGPEPEIGVGLNEISCALKVCVIDVFDGKVAGNETAEEVGFDVRSCARSQKVGHLRDHEIRNHERFADLLEPGDACLMIWIVEKGGCDQWSGVDDDEAQTNPSASRRSSATLAENPGLA